MKRYFRAVAPLPLGLCLVLATTGAARADDDDDAITPYRPTVSNPAQLPHAGRLELEVGGQRTRAEGGVGRSSVPYLFKLGFDKSWGLLVGGDARVWEHDGADRAQGVGDTSITLKRAWTVDDATAFGAELAVKMPTANDRIGSGKADYTLNTIFSRDLGRAHLDANLNGTRLGARDAATSRALLGASTSLSMPLNDHWGATAELSGTQQRGAGHGRQVLAALTWSPSKRLTFDLGVARAWRSAPGTTQIFTGVVLPVARLW